MLEKLIQRINKKKQGNRNDDDDEDDDKIIMGDSDENDDLKEQVDAQTLALLQNVIEKINETLQN